MLTDRVICDGRRNYSGPLCWWLPVHPLFSLLTQQSWPRLFLRSQARTVYGYLPGYLKVAEKGASLWPDPVEHLTMAYLLREFIVVPWQCLKCSQCALVNTSTAVPWLASAWRAESTWKCKWDTHLGLLFGKGVPRSGAQWHHGQLCGDAQDKPSELQQDDRI